MKLMRKRIVLLVAVAVVAALTAGGVVLAERLAAPKGPGGTGASGGRPGAIVNSKALRDAAQAGKRPAARVQAQSAPSGAALRAQAARPGALVPKWRYVPGAQKRASLAEDQSGERAALSLEAEALEALTSYPIGAQIVSSPAIYQGTVYVGSRDGKLHAIRLSDGQSPWAQPYDAGAWIDSSPRVYEGRIFFTARDGSLHAVNLDGTRHFRTATGGTNISSVAAAGGLLYFGSGYPGRDVYAVRMIDGVVQWRYETGQMVYSTPVVSGDTVYIGSDDGKYYALNAATGALRWSFTTQGGVFRASPAVSADGGVIFVVGGDRDENIYALNAANGTELHRYSVGGGYVSSPVVAGGVVYLQADGPGSSPFCHTTKLLALSYQAGSGFSSAWPQFRDTGYASAEGFASSPVVAGSVVFVGSNNVDWNCLVNAGYLYAYDAANGTLLDAVEAGVGVVSSPVVEGQTVVVGEYGGTVVAYDAAQALPAPTAIVPTATVPAGATPVPTWTLVPTPSVLPTSTTAPLPPTLTPPVILTVTPTPTITPTATIAPTASPTPTRTATPTITPIPTTGAIKGRVKLQGRDFAGGATVTIVELGLSRQTSWDGGYSFEAIAPGTYTVTVQMSKYLGAQRTGVSVVALQGVVLPDVRLWAGDVTDQGGAGRIDNNDLNFVVGYRDQSAPSGSAAAAADVNGDGVVDLKDITLVAGNLGKTSSPWQ